MEFSKATDYNAMLKILRDHEAAKAELERQRITGETRDWQTIQAKRQAETREYEAELAKAKRYVNEDVPGLVDEKGIDMIMKLYKEDPKGIAEALKAKRLDAAKKLLQKQKGQKEVEDEAREDIDPADEAVQKMAMDMGKKFNTPKDNFAMHYTKGDTFYVTERDLKRPEVVAWFAVAAASGDLSSDDRANEWMKSHGITNNIKISPSARKKILSTVEQAVEQKTEPIRKLINIQKTAKAVKAAPPAKPTAPPKPKTSKKEHKKNKPKEGAVATEQGPTPAEVEDAPLGAMEGHGVDRSALREIANRLEILVGERHAGNKSKIITKEIYDLLDLLLRYKKITKTQHKKIAQSLKLGGV